MIEANMLPAFDSGSVTAWATIGLMVFTVLLFLEAGALRREGIRARKEAQEPYLIMYTELNGANSLARIVVENVTGNPAFRVNFTFTPDCIIQHYRESCDAFPRSKHLSEIAMKYCDVIPPNHRIYRDYGIFNNGLGNNVALGDFETIVKVEYRDRQGNDYCYNLNLTTRVTNKTWWHDTNTLSAISDSLVTSSKSITREMALIKNGIYELLRVRAIHRGNRSGNTIEEDGVSEKPSVNRPSNKGRRPLSYKPSRKRSF